MITTMKFYKTIACVLGIVSIVSVLIACARIQAGASATGADAVLITPEHLKEIVGVEWHLKHMKVNNESISLIKDTRITFSCDETGKVAGVASINRYFGSFSLKEDGEIIWSKAFGMTRMAGPPAVMDQEAKFMRTLPLTSRFYLKKGTLVVTGTDRSSLFEFREN